MHKFQDPDVSSRKLSTIGHTSSRRESRSVSKGNVFEQVCAYRKREGEIFHLGRLIDA